MSFEVVLCHFVRWDTVGKICWGFRQYSLLAVPIFVIMAFMLSDVKRMALSKKVFINRMIRLVLPYVLWTFAYYIFFWGLSFWGISVEYKLDLIGLIASFLTGNYYNTALWFQVDLIVITCLLVLLSILFGNKDVVAYSMTFGFSLILQYSGVWYRLVNGILYGNVFYWTVGRFVELLPMACFGVCLFRLNITKKIVSLNVLVKMATIIILFVLLALLLIHNPYFENGENFMYGGVEKIIEGALTIVILYSISYSFVPQCIKCALVYISQYSVGVYFVHNMIGELFDVIGFYRSIGVDNGSFESCVLVFLASIIISIGIGSIPAKILKLSVS